MNPTLFRNPLTEGVSMYRSFTSFIAYTMVRIAIAVAFIRYDYLIIGLIWSHLIACDIGAYLNGWVINRKVVEPLTVRLGYCENLIDRLTDTIANTYTSVN